MSLIASDHSDGYLDFESINAHLLANFSTHLPEWLPGGKFQNDEYVVLNPTRDDRHPGSFKINVRSGKWIDHATGDKGGGPISLYAYLHKLSSYDAAKQLEQDHRCNGSIGLLPRATASTVDQGDETAVTGEVVVAPICGRGPEPPRPDRHPKLGQHDSEWIYRDENGYPLTIVRRYDDGQTGGKQFLPLTLWEDASGGRAWRWKSLPSPRPLYGLDRLADAPDRPVVVHEGEKACDAGRSLLPDHVHVTSSNGSQAANRSNWAPLTDRRVFIWPDNDEPGRKFAEDVRSELSDIASEVTVLAPWPEHASKGWDAADALSDDWGQEDVTRALNTVLKADDWAEIDELTDELLPVEDFSFELLPQALADFVKDVSHRMDDNAPDFCGIALVVGAAALIGGRAEIQPKQHDSSWTVRPTLWAELLVALARKRHPCWRPVSPLYTRLTRKIANNSRKTLNCTTVKNRSGSFARPGKNRQ